MRRLALNSIQIDTTSKKEKVIKNTLQLASEYRGNVLNSMICPLTYNKLSDNVVYYDGNEYTLSGSVISKNGEVVFSVDGKHLELNETEGGVNKDSDTYATKRGSVISYTFNSNSGTINVVDCGYDYFLYTAESNGVGYITLFPTKPTSYKSIKSWTVNGSTVTLQTRYFINSKHEIIDLADSRCKVGDKYICDVLYKDLIMSGDGNHTFYTARNDNEYFYSNIEFPASWLTDNCIMLATSSDGIYYGGFKVVNGDWSIDYYNNLPVQVSYKGKVMVNQVDYAYFNGTDVFVNFKDATYKLEIVEGVDISIVGDRFIVANSPDTYNNTYDMLEGKVFCRNDSYCGSVLWVVPENRLVDDVDKRGTFYVASGVNVQGQVDGSYLQGTILPSFPVWGLDTNSFELLDYWNETDRVIVQVYKGTAESPTVAEFAFSLGGFLDYSGYVYPSSTNTLYSVTEIDSFTETYNGVQLVKTPVGKFITAMNNTQTISFSYYLGTLVELDAVFVLQGTMYGVTSSGYIVSMIVENGTITATSIETSSGIMQFIGNTQDMALFYNPYEKWLYYFDSTRKMHPYKEFSVEEIKMFTCRACDNLIAIATPSSVYVLNGGSMYRIETSVNNLRYCQGWLLAGTNAYDSYDGNEKLDVEYDSGREGSTYDTSVQLDEVDIMLDDSDLKVPPYLEYRIDVDDCIGNVKEIVPDCSNVIRIKPTGPRNEGLYYRIWLHTNCNIMGVSVQDNAEKKPNLTRNNG